MPNQAAKILVDKQKYQLDYLINATANGHNKNLRSTIACLADITVIECRSELEDIADALHTSQFHREARQLEIKLNSII